MLERSDADLLRRYAAEGAEPAFTELVRRHLPFVYAAALRQTGGEAALAHEIAQQVFVDLARKADNLAHHTVLVGWLFTSTRYAAGNALRAERRRRAREQEAHAMNELHQDPAPHVDWTELRPVIDEVMAALGQAEREAVLLRFFEGRSFPEIGARFAITGDAARLRVERALDKMRHGLSRHGVQSTTGALALALANQPAIAVPSGLAATITQTVTSSTALAAAGGAAGGLSLFMSTTKSVAWSLAILALLASLAGNVYFAVRDEAPAASAPTPVVAKTKAPPPGPSAATAPAPTDAARMVKTMNVERLRDELRAAGASDEALRAIVVGIIRRRSRHNYSDLLFERAKRGWWQDEQLTRGMTDVATADNPWIYQTEVVWPAARLLGSDPLDLADEDARYGFLPEKLRRAFGQLERDVPNLGLAPTGDIMKDNAARVEAERLRTEVERKRAELMAGLTPEQRAAWDMHLSPLSSQLGRRLEPADATEQEFVNFYPIADRFATAQAPGGAPADRAEYQRQLVSTFGYDRALDLYWAGAAEYAGIARTSRALNLPVSTAGRTVQLAAETGNEAAKISVDPASSPEAKRAALAALQQRVRPELDALLPPAAQAQAGAASLAWFTALGNGSFKPINAAMPGAGVTTSGGIVNVASPNPPNVAPVPVPQRPANR